MNKKKLNILVLTLAFFLVFSAGVVWGRYSSSFDGDVGFVAGTASEINVQSGQWSGANGIQTLDFTVSNNGDMPVRIRIFVPEDTESPSESIGNLTVLLKSKGSSAEYAGKAEYLSSKTPLYKVSGAGWIYYFYNEAGKELLWTDVSVMMVTLEGENVDTNNFKLIVEKCGDIL